MPWTNASIVLNSRDRTGGTYNAAKFNAINQNVIQGQVHSISVNEINFPYDIPNIQGGVTPTNAFLLTNLDNAAGIEVTLGDGYYNGTELAKAINLDISGVAQEVGVPHNDLPIFSYSETDNLFLITPPASPSAPQAWVISSGYTFYGAYGQQFPKNALGKDIFSLMGYDRSQGAMNAALPAPGNTASFLYIVNEDYTGPSTIPPTVVKGPVYAAGAAPLAFTQYIDICSPLLCQYQYFRDGSTTNLARRSDVICRLYVSNNVATQEEEGARPFVIHRQFNNARVMRWSAEGSVGQIDINLFDDVGQPLSIAWNPRPYQITFNCYEQDKDSTTY
jgi:hypothetical protein